MVKKFFLTLAAGTLILLNVSFAVPPTFDQQIAKPLTTDSSGQNETAIKSSVFGIDPDKPLKENIYNLFSPLNNNSVIRQALRTVMTGILVLYIAWAGIDMMHKSGDEKGLQKARKGFLQIIFGAFLLWGAIWILGTGLKIGNVQGTQGLVSNIQNNVLFQVLAFFKGFAFFRAIIMFIYYGFQFMRAYEEEAKIKAARSGIINVIVALILIKIVDFIFYIAQQQNFASRMEEFIINAARIAGYVLGTGMVLSLIRGGIRYITSQGDEAKVKEAKSIIVTIFFIAMIIFLFLLIAYQIVAEFT